MAPRLAARTVIVCSLFVGVAIAHAEKRRVAVIDVSGEVTTSQLAKLVHNELINHSELTTIFDGEMFGLLVNEYEDEDGSAVASARQQRASAEVQLGQDSFAAAASAALSGLASLHNVTPTPASLMLYADLAFELGQARLGERKPAEARASFALAHRLAPGRALNPALYLPEVIHAYEQAKQPPAMGEVMVKGSGRVWIDGKERGLPGLHAVELGHHVVWLTGPDRETRGGHVVVGPGPAALIEIPEAPADHRIKIRRARISLRNAPDAAARASAMKQLAVLLDVREAILLTMANGKPVYQTWRDRDPGFSALREIKDAKPVEILDTIAPPSNKPKLAPQLDPLPPPPPIDTRAWYQKRGYQIAGGAAVISMIVGSVLLSRAIDGKVPLDTNPTAR